MSTGSCPHNSDTHGGWVLDDLESRGGWFLGRSGFYSHCAPKCVCRTHLGPLSPAENELQLAVKAAILSSDTSQNQVDFLVKLCHEGLQTGSLLRSRVAGILSLSDSIHYFPFTLLFRLLTRGNIASADVLLGLDLCPDASWVGTAHDPKGTVLGACCRYYHNKEEVKDAFISLLLMYGANPYRAISEDMWLEAQMAGPCTQWTRWHARHAKRAWCTVIVA